MTIKARLSAIMCAALMTGCANLNPLDGQDLTDGFAERVIEVNDAYRAERNAQILINILRARDRQDRKYTGLSPLKITPTAKESTKYTAAGIGLGNNVGDPWVKFGADRTLDGSSSIELTIQPYARDTKEAAIYTSPVTPEQFQSLWQGAWPEDIIRKLVIGDVTPLFLRADPGTNTEIRNNALVLDGLAKARGTYTVFSLPSEGELAHCFDPDDCKLEQFVEANPDDKTKPFKHFEYVLSATLPKAISLAPSARKPEQNPDDLLSDEKGRFIFCRQEGASLPVHAEGAPNADASVAHDVYRCSNTPVNPAVCAERDKDGKCTTFKNLPTLMFWHAPNGVYTISLNSIDTAIYRLGSELRRYKGEKELPEGMIAPACPEGLVCSRTEIAFSSERAETKLPLIAVGSDQTLAGKPLGQCLAQFSAAVRHSDGKVYYAGPPQAYAPGIGDGTSTGRCHVDDRTGTVLTVIAELIEMRQSPVAPAPPTLFFRE